MTKKLCIECSWCDLHLDLNEGSAYRCLKTGKTLPASILRRKACRAFISQPPFAHWGP